MDDLGIYSKYFSKNYVTVEDVLQFLRRYYDSVKDNIRMENYGIFGHIVVEYDNGHRKVSSGFKILVPNFTMTRDKYIIPEVSVAGKSLILYGVAYQDVIMNVAKEFGGYFLELNDGLHNWKWIEKRRDKNK